MDTYAEMLEKRFKELTEISECGPETRIEFLGSDIFDFTTYDSQIDTLFATKMIEVIEAILNRTTFEYAKFSRENYLNYLTMVNMPFLNKKLSWGTSIRGAWFENESVKNDMSQLLEWIKSHEKNDKMTTGKPINQEDVKEELSSIADKIAREKGNRYFHFAYKYYGKREIEFGQGKKLIENEGFGTVCVEGNGFPSVTDVKGMAVDALFKKGIIEPDICVLSWIEFDNEQDYESWIE